MLALTIERTAVVWYVIVIIAQFVTWIIAKLGARALPEAESASWSVVIFPVFDFTRRFSHNALLHRVVGAMVCAFCLWTIGRAAARGEAWDVPEVNLLAIGCLSAAFAFADLPAAAATLTVGAAAVATIAAAMLVREAGTPATAR